AGFARGVVRSVSRALPPFAGWVGFRSSEHHDWRAVSAGVSIIRQHAHQLAVFRRRWRLLSANQLIDSLAALPAARRLAAAQPITSSIQVGGIEVATATARNEAATRRIWRERQRGGATPLILLTDTATGG